MEKRKSKILTHRQLGYSASPMLPFAGPESARNRVLPENDHEILRPSLLGQAGPLVKTGQRPDSQTAPERKGLMGEIVHIKQILKLYLDQATCIAY